MRRAAPVLVAAAAVVLAACGGGDDRVEFDPGHPVDRLLPDDVGWDGTPRHLVVLVAPLQNTAADHGIQNAQAVKLVLAQRGWRAGGDTVALQVCDEASPDEVADGPSASASPAPPVRPRASSPCWARRSRDAPASCCRS